MCFMDWRIGRLIRAVFNPGLTDAAGTLTIPANTNRVGLTFFPSDVGASCLVRGIDTDQGLNVLMVGEPIGWTHINLATHGDLPTRKFFLFAGTAVVDHMSFIEYFAPEEMLAIALESLRKEYPGLGR